MSNKMRVEALRDFSETGGEQRRAGDAWLCDHALAVRYASAGHVRFVDYQTAAARPEYEDKQVIGPDDVGDVAEMLGEADDLAAPPFMPDDLAEAEDLENDEGLNDDRA